MWYNALRRLLNIAANIKIEVLGNTLIIQWIKIEDKLINKVNVNYNFVTYV